MMRLLPRALLRRVLRRDPREIEARARGFRITTERGRDLVSRLGQAFLGGYNAMLRAASAREVAEEGMGVAPHFRPFFFEGAAMGYLPRGYLFRGFGPESAERDLMAMHPRFRYLYYVGLGFWLGFRHPRRPAAIEVLAPHVDALYFPLCYDGFGFKVGFFDFPDRPEARERLERCPAAGRRAAYQGFGRALFFVTMDDPEAFRAAREQVPADRRRDLEFGRSLALAFTGVDRPETIDRHLAASRDEEDRAARLLGVTWALTAREMNDPVYFEACLATASAESAARLRRLPELCRAALEDASDYADWQRRTSAALLGAASAARRSAP